MKVSFESYVDGEKLEYVSDLEIIDGAFVFLDMLIPGTTIKIYKKDDLNIIERSGNTTQIMYFKEGQKIKTEYKNVDGMDFGLYVYTKATSIKENYFLFSYDLFLEENLISKHKILGKIIK